MRYHHTYHPRTSLSLGDKLQLSGSRTNRFAIVFEARQDGGEHRDESAEDGKANGSRAVENPGTASVDVNFFLRSFKLSIHLQPGFIAEIRAHIGPDVRFLFLDVVFDELLQDLGCGGEFGRRGIVDLA